MSRIQKNETEETLMDNDNKIILTGHPTSPTQRPPLPPKPQPSIRYDEYDLAGGFEEIKNLVKSLFKGSRK